jgi:hypothetical protein
MRGPPRRRAPNHLTGRPCRAARGVILAPCGLRHAGRRGRSWPPPWSGVGPRGPGGDRRESSAGWRWRRHGRTRASRADSVLDVAVGVELVEPDHLARQMAPFHQAGPEGVVDQQASRWGTLAAIQASVCRKGRSWSTVMRSWSLGRRRPAGGDRRQGEQGGQHHGHQPQARRDGPAHGTGLLRTATIGTLQVLSVPTTRQTAPFPCCYRPVHRTWSIARSWSDRTAACNSLNPRCVISKTASASTRNSDAAWAMCSSSWGLR